MMDQLLTVDIAGTDTIFLALDREKTQRGVISKTGLRMVGHAANIGREILMQRFTNRMGRDTLYYNNPMWRKTKGPLSSNKSGYYDRRGEKHRLIHYGLKSRGPFAKTAKLSSYPMNLWERPNARRPWGKWVMTVKLAGLVAAQSARIEQKAEKNLDAELQDAMDGGR
jgi:hypothetical protein